MKKVIVVGGGLAGLSCAAYLSEAGAEVQLFEASPKLGGRAYSFQDKLTSSVIDNGQHLMMGCYSNTLQFLELIGSKNSVNIQPELRVVFKDNTGAKHSLASGKNRYPVNLLKAIFNYSALSIKDAIHVIDLFLDLVCIEAEDVTNLNVKEWLVQEHQTENAIKCLWEILSIGTLNSRIESASAAVFVNVLKEIFLNGHEAARIVLPNVGLSEMYCNPAAVYITKRNSTINLSEKVTGIYITSESKIKITTNKTVYNNYDSVVLAVPLYALGNIKGVDAIRISDEYNMEYSPIVSVHLWLKQNTFEEEFYGFIDSKIHWLFNHGEYISLVTSAAYNLVTLDDKSILEIISCELTNNFSVFSPDLVLSYKIIKEKRATYVPTPESINYRNRIISSDSKIILAGDWTETMLPATIESAVISGKKAASKVLGNCS
jgi:squalene-associated FAD-dependent desaturase